MEFKSKLLNLKILPETVWLKKVENVELLIVFESRLLLVSSSESLSMQIT
jgi:hypothetical protein